MWQCLRSVNSPHDQRTCEFGAYKPSIMGYGASREEVIVETLSKEEIQQRQVKRTYIAKEILSTEISYVTAVALALRDWEVRILSVSIYSLTRHRFEMH